MIPAFNTRKIRQQLRRKRDSLHRRGDTDRSRALFIAWAKKMQPIHFEPDFTLPLDYMDEGYMVARRHRAKARPHHPRQQTLPQSPIPAEPKFSPSWSTVTPSGRVGQCYEIPREKVELLAEHCTDPHLTGLQQALFDARLASYANKNHLVYGSEPHRQAVLEGFRREGAGAWRNPWDDWDDILPQGDISDEDWCSILQMGKEMYGVLDCEPWHHSISLWNKDYWLTAHEAEQFGEIMVPCGEWEAHLGWEQQGSTNRTPRPLKRRILKDAEKIFRRKYAKKCGSLSPARAGMCPYWALAVIEAAGKHGKRLVLQAGSMQWLIVPPELDDGVSANAFAYMWSPNEPASRRAIAMGALPEVHVWAADPATKEIIDLSTRDFKRIAENQFGLKWSTKPPPPYLWVNQEEYMAMPDPTYSANQQATMFVLGLLRRKGLL